MIPSVVRKQIDLSDQAFPLFFRAKKKAQKTGQRKTATTKIAGRALSPTPDSSAAQQAEDGSSKLAFASVPRGWHSWHCVVQPTARLAEYVSSMLSALNTSSFW
jgi:hypothetical protein